MNHGSPIFTAVRKAQRPSWQRAALGAVAFVCAGLAQLSHAAGDASTSGGTERVSTRQPVDSKPVTAQQARHVARQSGRDAMWLPLKSVPFQANAAMSAMPGDSRVNTGLGHGGDGKKQFDPITFKMVGPGDSRAKPTSIDPQATAGTADTADRSDDGGRSHRHGFDWGRRHWEERADTTNAVATGSASPATAMSNGAPAATGNSMAPTGGKDAATAASTEPLVTRDGRTCDVLTGQCAAAPQVATQCVRGACVTAPSSAGLGAQGASARALERRMAALAAAPLAEIVPTPTEWRDARGGASASSIVPLSQTQRLASGSTVARVADCVNVGLRPDAQRPGQVHVDPTGGGLVHAVVPARDVARVLARTRFDGVDLAQPQAMCLPADLARALAQLHDSVPQNAAGRLVRTRSGWALAPARGALALAR